MHKQCSRDKLGGDGQYQLLTNMLWMQASFQMNIANNAHRCSNQQERSQGSRCSMSSCLLSTHLLTWAVADMGCLLIWTFTYSAYLVLQVSGASLNKPHTSVTVLHMCVCMVAWLWPHTINFKWAQINISQGLNVLVHYSSIESDRIGLLLENSKVRSFNKASIVGMFTSNMGGAK